jgi:hypothetical protein
MNENTLLQTALVNKNESFCFTSATLRKEIFLMEAVLNEDEICSVTAYWYYAGGRLSG